METAFLKTHRQIHGARSAKRASALVGYEMKEQASPCPVHIGDVLRKVLVGAWQAKKSRGRVTRYPAFPMLVLSRQPVEEDMDDEEFSVLTRAIKSVSDTVAHMAGVTGKHSAGMQVLLSLHLDTLFLLMESRLLTAQQCLERLTRVRGGLETVVELKPATDLVAALISIVRSLAERGPQRSDVQKAEEDSQAKLRGLLEKWPTASTKH